MICNNNTYLVAMQLSSGLETDMFELAIDIDW